MPTTRPRLTITETDEVASALDAAAKRWPGERRQQLLVRLVEEGRKAVDEERGAWVEERKRRFHAAAGRFSGVWPPGALEELRADWPE